MTHIVSQLHYYRTVAEALGAAAGALLMGVFWLAGELLRVRDENKQLRLTIAAHKKLECGAFEQAATSLDQELAEALQQVSRRWYDAYIN